MKYKSPKHNNKEILIISYVFPPYPGIGGRRWAKFAKYLSRKNYNVHVICAQNPFEETSLWSQDVNENPHIHIHSLPIKYPAVLLKNKLSFAEKILYRWSVFKLRLIYKGNIYDRALAWEKQLDKKIKALVKTENITQVIVTGAPFHLMYYTAKIVAQLPGVKLLADFRDPWTNGFLYGIKGLPPENRAVELKMEEEVVRKAGIVAAPAQEILNDLAAKHRQPKEKFVLLPHGFDPDDFPAVLPSKPKNGKIRGAFVGSVYDGIEPVMERLFRLIRHTKKPVSFQLDFYSKDFPRLHAAIHEENLEMIHFHQPLAAPAIFEKLATCDFALIMFSEPYKDFISTKFYELFYLKLPLLYIGPEGEVSRFIQKYNIGEWLPPEKLETDFFTTMQKTVAKTYSASFDRNVYSMEHVSEQLIALLERMNTF